VELGGLGKGKEGKEVEWPTGCSEVMRLRNVRPPPGARRGQVEKRTKKLKYKREREREREREINENI
jgi:hypothetical protein